MKHKDPDNLSIRLGFTRYVLCLLETMVSMSALIVFWFFTGFKIGLSDGRIKDLLENADFFNLHESENYIVSLCRSIKSFVDARYLITLLILTALFALIIIVRWKLCQRNSLVFMRFTAASLFCGGIFSVVLAVTAFFSKFWTGVSFENQQNELFFNSFVKSTILVFLAVGFIILVFAVLSQLLAETILKNREKSYLRKLKKERSYNEEGL